MANKKRHFVIPDTQTKHGVPLDHFHWLGQAIADYAPDRVIHLGDHWDCHSVSSYSGAKEREGERIYKDVEAGNHALMIMDQYMTGDEDKYILRGNHEERLDRYVDNHPEVEGLIGEHLFMDKQLGWKVVGYKNGNPGLKVIDGVNYAHYFSNPNTGRPIGGTAQYKLAAIGAPYVMGHVQGYDIGTKQFATGRVVRGIVAGSCYLHDEPYKGMANNHWRGALILNEVENGNFSEMPLTLDYLCQKYEGTTLKRYMQRKYRNAKSRFSIAA